MDTHGDGYDSLFEEWGVFSEEKMSEAQSALSASLSDLSSGSASSAMSSWGSSGSMSDEAISERAAVWGNGVAKIVLKNSSERTSSNPRSGSLSDSNSADSSIETVESPVHSKQLESCMRSSVRLAFMVCDAVLPDGPISHASPGFLSMTGYSPEEVVGKNCWFLQGEGTDAKEVGKMRSALRTGRVYSGTVLNYKKDGTPFWNLLNLSPIGDDEGRVIKYFGMHTEVGCPPTADPAQVHAKDSKANRGLARAARAEAKAKASDRLSRHFADEDSSSSSAASSPSSGGSSDSGHARSRQRSKRGGAALPVFAIPASSTAPAEDDAEEESIGSNWLPSADAPNRSPSTDFDQQSEFRSAHRSKRYSLTIPRSYMVEMYRRDSQLFALTSDGLERLQRCSIDDALPSAERNSHASAGKKSCKGGGKARPALTSSRSLDSSNPLVWFLAAARCTDVDDAPKASGGGGGVDEEKWLEKHRFGTIESGKSPASGKGRGAFRVLGRVRICRNMDLKQWVIQPLQKQHISRSFDQSTPEFPIRAESASTPPAKARATRVGPPEDQRYDSSFQISPFRLSLADGAEAVQIQLTPTRHSIADLRQIDLNQRRQFIIVHS